MYQKFDFIILPPDGMHLTLRDRLCDARLMLQSITEAIEAIMERDASLLIKYRSKNHFKNFQYGKNTIIGYGTLLDYCKQSTTVVGMPGSATIECLMNDIAFYSYCIFLDDIEMATNRCFLGFKIQRALHIAKSAPEVLNNIQNRRIYKKGFSNKDLLYEEGISLQEIVDKILKTQDEKRV